MNIKKYDKSIDIFLKKISKENLIFLRNLKDEYYCTFDDLKIAMFHGSPWNKLNEYVYPNYDFRKYEYFKYDYIFQGHTHYRMHEKVGNINIINPGSIGQSRDWNLPSYVLLDTSKKQIRFFSVKYNFEKLISKIELDKKEPKYLIDVLKRGWKW